MFRSVLEIRLQKRFYELFLFLLQAKTIAEPVNVNVAATIQVEYKLQNEYKEEYRFNSNNVTTDWPLYNDE
jgi:hypothetical protein